MTGTKQRDTWEKLNSVAAVIASVLIPVVVVIVGNGYTSAVRNAEIRARYTELAIGILQAPPTAETEYVRRWAIAVVEKHSGVPLQDRAVDELLAGTIATYLELDAGRSAQVDSFLSVAWIPVYAAEFARSVRAEPAWKNAIGTKNSAEIEELVQAMVELACEAAVDKRHELQGDPDALREEIRRIISQQR